MKERHRRIWAGFGFLVLFAGLGTTFALFASKPDYFSSPTAARNSHKYRTADLGVLEAAKRQNFSGRPPEVEMAVPERVEGKDSDFLLEWNENDDGKEEDLPERWTEKLTKGEEIDLVAFATWTPAAEDDVSENAEWRAALVFRDPVTLEILSESELGERGVPDRFRSLDPESDYGTPKMRFLFRAQGMEHPRILRTRGGDSRTGAQVTFSLDSLGNSEPVTETEGEWTRFDVALLIWHDSPCVC